MAIGKNRILAGMEHAARAWGSLGRKATTHLDNVSHNLQLVADMGYGDAALAVVRDDGSLEVVDDARPNTAVAPFAASRAGRVLSADDEPEAYRALSSGDSVVGTRRRITRGISYVTAAYPIGDDAPFAVVVRDVAQQVVEAPGAMEKAFMDIAEELLDALRIEPLRDPRTGEPFATERRAGDGVIRVNAAGTIGYASPNAVNIMRLAGVEGSLVGSPASELPGAALAISPALGTSGAGMRTEIEVGERVFGYRTIALPAGAVILVEDRTEARRREQQIKVKEATIREVHHRVKNNLQTIASLLRIQARRAESEEARRALAEATERVGSMAVVHDLLAGSEEERVDFAEAARTVVDLVRSGLAGESSAISVSVEGSSGQVDARTATSLALATAELVHNAIEHGFTGSEAGSVVVSMRRVPGELVLTVRDDGVGLPEGFEAVSAANLGLAIVRTVVEDDLRGTLAFSGGRGTTVTVRVPVSDHLPPSADPSPETTAPITDLENPEA
ncbi:MAG: histidine kinase N-terminal domain-containing protein [Coriobacteriales bacterium]|nr:histidine kinase N-terminal domain-containing protein [Coriobacteriales bacterium]